MHWDLAFTLESIFVSWPPVLLGLWLGRKKINRITARQTAQIATLTDKQTEYIKPGWTGGEGDQGPGTSTET